MKRPLILLALLGAPLLWSGSAHAQSLETPPVFAMAALVEVKPDAQAAPNEQKPAKPAPTPRPKPKPGPPDGGEEE